MLILELFQDPFVFFAFLIAILIAVTFHEFIHAFVANLLGDETAKYAGRLTLNPLKHLDPVGTLALLFFGFGWGKPVPYNPSNLMDEKKEVLVAFSGSFANFILAFLFALPLRFLGLPEILTIFLQTIVTLNIFLCVFNLLPIPPLDGSKIFYLFFPNINRYTFERMGIFILLFILIFPSLHYLVIDTFLMRIVSFLLFLVSGSYSIPFF